MEARPSVSYILPHKDRIRLLSANLLSLSKQTDKDFEIVITDNSADPELLKKLVENYRSLGLRIKAATVDPTRCHFMNKAYAGFCNPALQINVASKLADGDILVLSSPEVINADTNVAEIKKHFAIEEFKTSFLYGWIDEKEVEIVLPYIKKGITNENIRTLCAKTYGEGYAKCREEEWHPHSYFIGALPKQLFMKVGGIDERYMYGHSYEDDDFVRRLRYEDTRLVLSKTVSGIHLCHPRNHGATLPSNGKLFAENNFIANQNHDWGSLSTITQYL